MTRKHKRRDAKTQHNRGVTSEGGTFKNRDDAEETCWLTCSKSRRKMCSVCFNQSIINLETTLSIRSFKYTVLPPSSPNRPFPQVFPPSVTRLTQTVTLGPTHLDQLCSSVSHTHLFSVSNQVTSSYISLSFLQCLFVCCSSNFSVQVYSV